MAVDSFDASNESLVLSLTGRRSLLDSPTAFAASTGSIPAAAAAHRPNFSVEAPRSAVMDAAAWGTEKLKGGGRPLHAEREGLLRPQILLLADHVRHLEGQGSAS